MNGTDLAPVVGGDTLDTVLTLALFYLGVPFFSAKLLERIRPCKWDWLQRLPWGVSHDFGWKRIFAIAAGCAASSAIWGFGLYLGTFPLPAGDPRVWIRAWFGVIFPTGLMQQIVHGFMKKAEGA